MIVSKYYQLGLLLFYLVFFIEQNEVFAQTDRSKAPAPAPAPVIKIGKYQSFTLKNGLQVFVVTNHKLPKVAFQLAIDIPPILEGEKTGYISAFGDLLARGTKNRSKAQIDEEIDFIGASLSASATGIYGVSLKKHTPTLLNLFADVLLNPSFPVEELEKIKLQTKSGLAAQQEEPNAIAARVRSTLLYGKNHPYGELTTEKTIENINVNDCRTYYDTYFRPQRAYLAIVGDITLPEAKKLVNQFFSKWEKKEATTPILPPVVAPQKTKVVVVNKKEAVQSLISVCYPINLKPGSDDAFKMSVLNAILGGGGFNNRLMQNLREDKAYTYGASSSYKTDKIMGSFQAGASVRTSVTDSAVYQIIYEMRRLLTDSIGTKELEMTKNRLSGSFARSLENPQTVASFAINTAMYGLSPTYYQNYLTNLEKITVADLKTIAQKYIKPENAYILVVGNAKEVAAPLQKFGEVVFYDTEGNVVVSDNNTSLNITDIFKKYIQAIGGEEKIRAINDVYIKSEAATMLGDLKIITQRKKQQKIKIEAYIADNQVSKQVTNGVTGKVTLQGKDQILEGEKLRQIIDAATLFEEMYLDSTKATLIGTTVLEGKKCYEVHIALGREGKKVKYYDTETGFLLKEEAPLLGTLHYAHYESVEGIKFPYSIKVNTPFGMLETRVREIKINTGLPNQLFDN
jgi:predicted Zn-dependent peptidase